MPNFVKKLAPSFFPVALLKGRRLIDRQQRNCKRVESLSQKTKTYAAFIRQPTMNAPPSPLTNPPKGALEVSEGVWHIVNAHSTLCHFVLMACLPHSFYIKPARDSALIWGDGGSQPLASYFGFNFLFFFSVLVGVNKSLNKKPTMQLKATLEIKKVRKINNKMLAPKIFILTLKEYKKENLMLWIYV